MIDRISADDLKWIKKKKFSYLCHENQYKCDLCDLKTKHKSIIYSHSKKHKSKSFNFI